MSHEIKDELGRRNRALPNRDASHYQTTKLVVQKVSLEQSMVSLVVTDVAGHRLSDTRLAWCMIKHVDNVGRQLSPSMVLAKALEQILNKQLQDR